MKGFDLHEYMESYRKLEDSLCRTVKISHREVDLLVVSELINKRNSDNLEYREAFDKVLRFYLDEEEFIKYVINKEELT